MPPANALLFFLVPNPKQYYNWPARVNNFSKGGEMTETHPSFLFVTASIRNHRHLLVHEGCARIALQSLAWLRQRGGIELFGFVVVPSRLQFLCRPKIEEGKQLLARFEEFTSARITDMLRRAGRNFLVQSFYSNQVKDSIWSEVRAEEVCSAESGWRQLDYMHRLPLAREWRLADAPEDYPLASACFYAAGRPAVIGVDDLRLERVSGLPEPRMSSR
jgi:hypothetical protein